MPPRDYRHARPTPDVDPRTVAGVWETGPGLDADHIFVTRMTGRRIDRALLDDMRRRALEQWPSSAKRIVRATTFVRGRQEVAVAELTAHPTIGGEVRMRTAMVGGRGACTEVVQLGPEALAGTTGPVFDEVVTQVAEIMGRVDPSSRGGLALACAAVGMA